MKNHEKCSPSDEGNSGKDGLVPICYLNTKRQTKQLSQIKDTQQHLVPYKP